MKTIIAFLSAFGLLLTILPSLLLINGTIEHRTLSTLMLAGMFSWLIGRLLQQNAKPRTDTNRTWQLPE